MNTIIGIAGTCFIGLVAFIVTRFEKRIDQAEKKADDSMQKSNEIVVNYMSRFEEIKDLLSKANDENHRSHADIMEFVHFIRTKINDIAAKEA